MAPVSDSHSEPGTHPAAHIATVRVEYPTGPDRCTIFPRAADGLTLMATWLTANGDAFVDLDAMR